MGGMIREGSAFFSEEKKQKTFFRWGTRCIDAYPNLVLFFKKELLTSRFLP
jgi:hypothetical protein